MPFAVQNFTQRQWGAAILGGGFGVLMGAIHCDQKDPVLRTAKAALSFYGVANVAATLAIDYFAQKALQGADLKWYWRVMAVASMSTLATGVIANGLGIQLVFLAAIKISTTAVGLASLGAFMTIPREDKNNLSGEEGEALPNTASAPSL